MTTKQAKQTKQNSQNAGQEWTQKQIDDLVAEDARWRRSYGKRHSYN